jgi:hypothetical protein
LFRNVLGHEYEGTKEHYEGALPEVALMELKMLAEGSRERVKEYPQGKAQG